MRRPLAYIARPVGTYGSAYERRALAALRRLLPGAELLNPAAMFTSSEDWLDRWPDVLDSLDGLVLFTEEQGAIGAGCVQEVYDAHRRLVPVALFDPGDRKLRRLAGLDFPDLPTPRNAGHPVAGEVLAWELAARPPRIREAS